MQLMEKYTKYLHYKLAKWRTIGTIFGGSDAETEVKLRFSGSRNQAQSLYNVIADKLREFDKGEL